MGIFTGFSISGSGLTAQRFRMNVVSNNIANLETTSTPEGGPYIRREVVLSPLITRSLRPQRPGLRGQASIQGVEVAKVQEDRAAPKVVYEPDHPDANADGFVTYPNIDLVSEIIDMNAALRAYEANVTALNSAKAMAMKALEIGRA
ncbi:MAG: flagellar basal body rod protein FlgC [Chloroflexi bacterium]|nr:flagellar basal body rod protein FlgC [Chloroflexota bacterium]